MARPSKCTPEVIAKVCEALKLGVSWAAAAAHAGLDEATLTGWKQRAKDGEEPFLTFLTESTRARDSAEVRMAAIVLKAAQEGSVNAAQWWLERRRGDTWGRSQEVVINAPDSGVPKLLERLTGNGTP